MAVSQSWHGAGARSMRSPGSCVGKCTGFRSPCSPPSPHRRRTPRATEATSEGLPMTAINRRELIAGAAGAVAVLLARRRSEAAGSTAAGAAAPAGSAIPPAPVARVAVVTDNYFGEALRDPYRWMENDQDPEWLPYLRGQNAHTRAVLDRIPNRDKLLARIQQLSGDA